MTAVRGGRSPQTERGREAGFGPRPRSQGGDRGGVGPGSRCPSSVGGLTRTMATLETLPLDELDDRFASLRLMSPTEMTRLRASVEREGVRQPVVVSTGVERERYVLLDGFKRVRILREQGASEVPATLVTLDATASKAAIVTCNAPHRGLSDLEEAWIVQSLCRGHRVSQVDVGRLLSHHKSWVCRRLKLAEHLEESVQDDIRLGLLSSSTARELARLPRGNQQEVAQAVRDGGLTSRQAAQLVTLLLQTDEPDARRAILDDPARYIPVPESHKTVALDPRLSSGGNEIRRGLLSLRQSSRRLSQALQAFAPAGLSVQDGPVLLPLVEGVHHEQREMETRLLRLLGESASPRGDRG